MPDEESAELTNAEQTQPTGESDAGQEEGQTQSDSGQAQATEGHNFDKGLQKLQMKQAETDRKIQQLLELSQRREEAQPKKDDLDDVFSDDLASESERKLAKRLQDLEGKLNEKSHAYDTVTNKVAAELVQLREEQHRNSFELSNPELKGKYDTLRDKAREELSQYDSQSDEVYNTAAKFVWEKVVSEAKSGAASATDIATGKASTKPAKDPARASMKGSGPKSNAEPSFPRGKEITDEDLHKIATGEAGGGGFFSQSEL